MGYDGWMQYNGVEIVNSQRTATYVKNYGVAAVACSGCNGATSGVRYSDPVTDNAPWLDPAVPWSKDFLGFFGITVGGVTVGTGSRTPLAKVGDGAVMGQLRHAHREINAHAMGFALSEQGMSWGQTWLSGILQAGSSIPACNTASCNGVPVNLLAWCPNCADDPVACAAANRTLFQGALMQGPDFTNKVRIGMDCGRGRPWMWDSDFLIGTGRPYAFQDPITVATQAPLIVPTVWPCGGWQQHTPGSGTCTLPDCSTTLFGQCMVWTPVSNAACNDPCDVLGGDCLLNDPLCPSPVAPVAPVEPNDPCVCLVSMSPVTTMTTITAGTLPRTAAFVPLLQVNAGTVPAAGAPAACDLRRILLRFYRASAGEVCTYANLSTCDVAGEIGIPYLPKGSVLTIDGRQQTATVVCADGRVETPVLFTSDGPMAQWPVLGCSDAWCVAVTIDGGGQGGGVPGTCGTNADSWVSVSVAIRDDVW